MINSAFRAGKNYYPQVFLEECKYVVKEKMPKCIFEGTEFSSDGSIKNILMKNILKKIQMKKILMNKSRLHKILVLLF